MPNVSITYQDVDDCAIAMKAVATSTLIPAKDAAKQAIDELMVESLVMPETGQAITDMFGRVYEALTQLTEAVPAYAEQFRSIKTHMQEWDAEYAQRLRNG